MPAESRFGVVWEEKQGTDLVRAEKSFPSRTELGLEMVKIVQKKGFVRFLSIWNPEGEVPVSTNREEIV